MFTPVSDPGEAQGIALAMWQVLSAAPCWVATTNTLQQYQFYGEFQFRYSGIDTHAGVINLRSIGWYGPYRAALVDTWDTQYLAVIDPANIVTATPFNGSYIITYYRAGTSCL